MKNNISRRSFLKIFGAGAVAGTAAMYGCGGKSKNTVADSQTGSRAGEPPTDQMTYRVNPNTGDKVSLLGFGMMRFPTRQKEDGKGIEINQEIVNQLVDYAIARGVNYFDCSPRYIQGLCEGATGKALSRHPRDKYFVATKLSNFDSASQTREGSIKMYRDSFKELQVDVIDYYLLHSIGGGGVEAFNKRNKDNGMIDFLLEERKKGKIRNLGFSYHGDIETFDFAMSLHETIHWDFVQIQLNYIDWRHAAGRNTNGEYLYTELEKRGIPAVIMEPLLGGRLASLPHHIFMQLKSRRPEDSAAAWAFRFAGSLPGVLTSLSGMTNMEHLRDNLFTHAPLLPLTDEEMALLDSLAEEYLQYPLVPCNDCDYCMPCPYGIDIPGTFTYYNKMVNEGSVPKNLQDPEYRRLRRNFLIGYARAMQPERQADHCIGCNQCIEKCPQRIRVPQQMQRINKYIEDLKQQREFS